MNPFRTIFSKKEEELCSQCHGSRYYCDDCNIIECECGHETDVCWFCQGRGSIKIKILPKELDLLTLKVCEVISNQGFENVHNNESHNYVRDLLKDFLTQWLDFDIEKHLPHTICSDLRK